MISKKIKLNAIHLAQDIKWFESLIEYRVSGYSKENEGKDDQSKFAFENARKRFAGIKNIAEILPPVFENISDYSVLVDEFALAFSERALLVLALIPHLSPA